MKKFIALVIIALFALSSIGHSQEQTNVLDFDDVDYLEIVKA